MNIKKFSIFGDIVQESDKQNDSDVCLQDFKNFIDTLEDGDNVVIEICSCGGDVFQGIAMSNLINQCRSKGCHFKAHVISIAASIASVIACACDEIEMDSNAMIMCHLPWTIVQGNEIDLAKQIKQLEQCKKALISFYKSKFELSYEEIEKMLIDETWIDSSSIGTYNLKCTVLDVDEDFKIAAKLIDRLQNFNKLPTIIQKALSMKNETKTEELEKTETAEEVEKVEKTEDTCKKAECGECEEEKKEKKEEVKAEDTQEEVQPTVEELQQIIAELQKKIEELEKEKEAPTDERVAGMQSTMQAKINTLTKDFKEQLGVCSKELAEYKDKAISLKAELDKANGELQKTASALAEKETALATLNASVNTPSEKTEVDYKKLHGQEFFDWLKKNNIR